MWYPYFLISSTMLPSTIYSMKIFCDAMTLKGTRWINLKLYYRDYGLAQGCPYPKWLEARAFWTTLVGVICHASHISSSHWVPLIACFLGFPLSLHNSTARGHLPTSPALCKQMPSHTVLHMLVPYLTLSSPATGSSTASCHGCPSTAGCALLPHPLGQGREVEAKGGKSCLETRAFAAAGVIERDRVMERAVAGWEPGGHDLTPCMLPVGQPCFSTFKDVKKLVNLRFLCFIIGRLSLFPALNFSSSITICW